CAISERVLLSQRARTARWVGSTCERDQEEGLAQHTAMTAPWEAAGWPVEFQYVAGADRLSASDFTKKREKVTVLPIEARRVAGKIEGVGESEALGARPDLADAGDAADGGGTLDLGAVDAALRRAGTALLDVRLWARGISSCGGGEAARGTHRGVDALEALGSRDRARRVRRRADVAASEVARATSAGASTGGSAGDGAGLSAGGRVGRAGEAGCAGELGVERAVLAEEGVRLAVAGELRRRNESQFSLNRRTRQLQKTGENRRTRLAELVEERLVLGVGQGAGADGVVLRWDSSGVSVRVQWRNSPGCEGQSRYDSQLAWQKAPRPPHIPETVGTSCWLVQ
ncbi:hypothetical protein RTBOTA2_001210, partial [Rhodotorula toruloides]